MFYKLYLNIKTLRKIILTKQVLFLLLLSMSYLLKAQPSAAIISNTFSVKSISISDANYDDLEPLKQSIGTSRVVMLGENDHGDGETFKAKARLVRFLHEEMGFTVLAFESDFYSISRLWETNKNSDNTLKGVYGIWRNTEEFSDMASYLKNNPTLSIAGFDCQLSNNVATQSIFKELDSLALALKYPRNDSVSLFFKNMILANNLMGAASLPDSAIHQLRRGLNQLIIDINKSSGADDSFWEQVMKSFLGNIENSWINRRNPEGYSISKHKHVLDLRDKQMADNLAWLLKVKYPTEKVIVWAHNLHISKATQSIDVANSSYPRIANTTMGNELEKVFEGQVYSLGFHSSHGKSGSPFQRNGRPYSIKSTGKSDLYTTTLSTLKWEYAFTDFKKIRTVVPADSNFVMRGWGYEYPISGNWFNAFDGIFYIRTNSATHESPH
jgi:erythromycin esterase